MLDSRYIYLHQSLGLGPMWLSNNANIVNQVKKAHQAEITSLAKENNQLEQSINSTAKTPIPDNTTLISTSEIISTQIPLATDKEQPNNQATPIESETFTRLKLNGLSSQFISKSGKKIFCFTISSSSDSNKPFPDNYAQLMDQLMTSLSDEPINWQFIRDVDGTNWLNKFDCALNSSAADVIIFLSEMICAEVSLQTLLSNYSGKIINILHPARLINIPQLKSKVWKDLAPLIVKP